LRRLIIVLLFLELAACNERQIDRSQSVTTTATTGDSATFSNRALAELSALRAGITPTQWLQAHPADSLERFLISDDVNQDSNRWCARLKGHIPLSDGSTMARYAYFYPPTAPASLELPAEADSNLTTRECTLGAIWVETPQQDSIKGLRTAEDTRTTLGTAYGKIVVGRDSIADSVKPRMRTLHSFETDLLGISFFGASAWHAPGRWQRGPVTAISAFDDRFREARNPPRVLAFAFLPISGFERERGIEDSTTAPTPAEDTALDLAASLEHLDTTLVNELLALRTKEEATDRLAPITAWLAAARNLSVDQRAAALFIADAVMPEFLSRDDTSTRRAYADIGIKYAESQLDGTYNYTHTLLEEALRLDPSGPIGELATIEMLDRGYNLNGMCSGGFDDVIRSGEALLPRLKSPDARAHVMFDLGDAYSDIVGLAAGAGEDYADTTKFKPRGANARRKALDYYRQGFALDSRSSRARASWSEAWSLLAGLPPSRLHFFCVYD
jgi:hypothetical protein